MGDMRTTMLMQPGTEDIGPEDLTGHVTCGWNGSLTPYRPSQQEPAPVPEHVRATLQRIRHEAMAKVNADEMWVRVPRDLRRLLLALCTERGDIEIENGIRWSHLTETERFVIGQQARSFVRGLAGVAEGLR